MEKYTTSTAVKLKNKKGQPWQAIVQYKDENGKWRHKTKVIREAKGKKEADKMAEEWRVELNKEAKKEMSITETVYAVIENYLDKDKLQVIYKRSLYYEKAIFYT